jgi:hypothetical protein
MCVSFTAHSQASSPRIVTSPQLPSPRTFVAMITFENAPLFNFRNVQGTCTPQVHARAGRTMQRSGGGDVSREINVNSRRPLTLVVLAISPRARAQSRSDGARTRNRNQP